MKNKLLLHIPHSSSNVPDYTGFEKTKLEDEIALLTDHATDKIFTLKDVDQILFPYSRVFCDVERFDDDKQEEMAKYGRGFFYTKCDDGSFLRSEEKKQEVLENYYRVHHQKLNRMCSEKLEMYNACLLIDCHSFADKPFLTDLNQTDNRPDICLGTDAIHTPTDLQKQIQSGFEHFGYTVQLNSPYAGTMIPLSYYGKDKRLSSIMIEVNRKLYMHDGLVQNKKVTELNLQIEQIFSQLSF